MRYALLILALAAALALAACGDDETTTVTETETVGTETEATETTETTATAGPSGELTSTGVGELTVGSTTQDARELFGRASRAEIVPGCELAGPNAEEVISWTYDLDGGFLGLTFDAASSELKFYRATSPTLETTLGDRVGDPYSSVKENWGDELKPVPIGTPTPKNGLWWVRDGKQELLFDVIGGKVSGISGGEIEFCE